MTRAAIFAAVVSLAGPNAARAQTNPPVACTISGIIRSDRTPLPGVVVTLATADGRVVGLTSTAPDGTYLLLNEHNGDLTRFNVDGSPPQLLMQGVHIEPDAFRPPNGAQILHERVDDQRALYVVNLDGSGLV